MIGGLDFADLGTSLGLPLTREQSFFLFVVPLLVLAALAAKNIVRSRPGRAFQAIRDREIAAAIIGVDRARYKVAAFAVSSFYAAAAGAPARDEGLLVLSAGERVIRLAPPLTVSQDEVIAALATLARVVTLR